MAEDVGASKAMNKEFKVTIRGEEISGNICRNYLSSKTLITYMSLAVPLLLEIINVVLKIVTALVVEGIRYDNSN